MLIARTTGAFENPVPLHLSDTAEWWQTWEVNVRGSYLPAREALRQRFGERPPSEAPAAPELTIIFTS